MEKRIVAIAGPTAVGKTAVAIHLAERLGGEIVSADSVQVYRYLDIGTAKPTAEEQRRVRHHLIDICDPEENYTVADYQKDARRVICGLWEKKIQPVLVGGSGLYLRAVLQNYAFSAAGADKKIRESLWQMAEQLGSAALHERLRQVDPVSAERIHPNDTKRIIRALEVYEISREPLSRQAIETVRSPEPEEKSYLFGLNMPREELYRRIEERVDRMMEAGLVKEVQGLLERGYNPDCKALQSLGYRQIVDYLAGRYDLASAVETIKRETRRFAKRQLTWFRREKNIIWLDARQTPEETAENIYLLLQEINK